ncbi:hypothetical protein ACXHXM_01825|uniref:hypothetical protein n=1 Tax=Rhizobium altiplani TaxID=1864509 RepID=UPI000A574603|nr:hypothetical protein [Rhizobium altiplani]
MSVDGEVEIVDLENWPPMGFGSPIFIEQPGKLTIEAMFDDENDWTLLRTLHVAKGPVIGPT